MLLLMVGPVKEEENNRNKHLFFSTGSCSACCGQQHIPVLKVTSIRKKESGESGRRYVDNTETVTETRPLDYVQRIIDLFDANREVTVVGGNSFF